MADKEIVNENVVVADKAVHVDEKKLSLGDKNILEVKIAVQSVVDSLDGFEVVETKFSHEFGKLNLTVFIWNKLGISLDDCVVVHNALSPELDRFEESFPEEYVLNVSSSGLDRLIVSSDDFRRALDTEIEVFQNDNKCHGVLVAQNENEIIITIGGKTPKDKTILRKNITKVQPYIRF